MSEPPSAIVGLFTTIALSPTVGYLGKMVNDVQVVKMKSVCWIFPSIMYCAHLNSRLMHAFKVYLKVFTSI